MIVEQLNDQAKWRRELLMSKKPSLEQLDDLERESLEEVQAGFFRGPMTVDQVGALLQCEDWSLTKRFAIYQGEKVRIIDSYMESAVNAAFASSSYLALQDTDFVVGFLRFVMVVCQNTSGVIVPLADGAVLRGPWHKSVSAKLDFSRSVR